MLEKEVFSQMKRWPQFQRFIFQQDEAKPHTATGTLMLLYGILGDGVISNIYPKIFNKGWSWPLYSPDLSPLDYFLWGSVKDCYHTTKPATLAELKTEIIRTFEEIDIAILNYP